MLIAIAAPVAAAPLFSEDFEGSLASQWTGRNNSGTSGVIVKDPVRNSNNVLSFRSLASGGDLFSKAIGVSKGARYRLSFQYLGRKDSGGGIVGVSLGTPGHHRWLAGTAGGRGAGERNPLINDSKWRTYHVNFSPGDHTWFTSDGARAEDPGAITSLRIMLEQNWGTPGDAYFDNFELHKCTATCSPVRVSIRFHAERLSTLPPSDGGQCGDGRQRARVTGTISAQITPDGDHQGGGDVDATPYRSRCRVPNIDVRVTRVRLRVIEPGQTLRAILNVRITASGPHRPGDCRVGTRGTITATYNDAARGTNGLRADRVRIGPWRACDAHEHTITNSMSSIPADASGSTWVRVNIACLGPGYSPRNC